MEKKRTKRCRAKQVIGIGKVYPCRNYIKDDQKFCDSCLLNRFGLSNKGGYDSEDTWSMTLVYREDDVIAALRLASKL